MHQTSNQAGRSATQGPGELLCEARRRLGLEPENVAQILHLSTRQIESIETNNFASLPEPTYVRGYMRSYSQLVGLDPEEVIRLYNDAIGGWKTTTFSGLTTEKQVTSRDNVVRFASMGVIGLVVGLAMVWWLGEGDAPEPVPAPTEIAATPLEPEIGPGDAPTESMALPAPGIESEKTALPAVVPDAAPAAVPEAPARQNAVAENVPTPRPVERPAREAPAVPAGTHSKLVLRTRGPVWADIRDVNDNKLLYESVSADRVIAVEGESPIYVFLGNADAVSLEFNGADFDFSAFKRGRTARFILGKSKTKAQEQAKP